MAFQPIYCHSSSIQQNSKFRCSCHSRIIRFIRFTNHDTIIDHQRTKRTRLCEVKLARPDVNESFVVIAGINANDGTSDRSYAGCDYLICQGLKGRTVDRLVLFCCNIFIADNHRITSTHQKKVSDNARLTCFSGKNFCFVCESRPEHF